MADEITIQILTAYQTVNAENWPGIWVDYPPERGSDRTGLRPPATPNSLIVECSYDTTVLAALLADPAYGPAAVLWQAEVVGGRPEDVPSSAEFAALRAKLVEHGWRTAEIDAAVGTVVNGQTRKELAEKIVSWLRDNEQS